MLAAWLPAIADLLPYQNPSLSSDERAIDLVSRMTLEEKVGRMVNGSGPVERLGISQYDWWNEALHGVARAGLATVFPQTIGLAATFDEDAVLKTYDIVSDEARAKYHDFQRRGEKTGYKGLTFWTPNINIFRDPRWGRGQETYGEDPFLTSRMGLAVVHGLQGDGSSRYDKAHACAKHFAVHSGPEWNRHKFNVDDVNSRDLYETYLPAFKALVVKGGVKEVMCAYNSVDGEPCCGNKRLLSQILRKDWGFDDVVVSDCGAIGDFFKPNTHQTHVSAEEAASDAVVSGTDLECVDVSYHTLIDAVKKGLISEDKINKSVFRLMRARFQLGMFDPDSLVNWSNIPYSVVNCQKHRDHALEMAKKSMTLLSNTNGTLPLDKNIRKIAVVGPNAADSLMMLGNYNGTPSHTVTILEGICNKVPESEIVYARGCNHVKSGDIDFKSVADSISDSDIIIFVGGISPNLEGEEMPVDLPGFHKGDRTSIELPEVQIEMLKKLKSLGKPIVFVMSSGSAVALPWVADNVDAILQTWYPGQEGGTAVADVLFGDYNPAGRLPVTFYASTSDLPDFENYSMDNRTYRYFKGEPLYPFGHGLSYTNFKYGKAKLADKHLKLGNDVKLSIPLSNIGKRDGEEVVQVYVRKLNSPEAPLKSLAAFKRLPLKSGEKTVVNMTIPASAFEYYSESEEDLVPMSGEYELLYGPSSSDSKLSKLKIKL